jgi:hypothetical protein
VNSSVYSGQKLASKQVKLKSENRKKNSMIKAEIAGLCR